MTLVKLVGMPADKALKLVKDTGLDAEIKDFSAPDKYHKDTPASLRVVKAIQSENVITLLVAGFKDTV